MKLNIYKQIPFFVFVFLCTIWIGVFFILPDFYDNPASGIGGFVILFLHWGLICAATFSLLYIMAIYKYLFAVLFPIFCFVGSLLGFFRFAYKTSLTPMLIDATLHNDLRTSLDVISYPFAIFMIINLLIAFVLVRYRLKIPSMKGTIFHVVFSILLFSSFFVLSGRVSNSIIQRFPFSVYYNFTEYQKLQSQFSVFKYNPDSTLSAKSNDSITVILVLGESLRSDHLSMNGYTRNTNPKLSKRANVLSFPNIYTEYTNTGRSLPHILTRADSVHESRAFKEMSFIQLFKQCGYNTAWISNQDPSDSYVSFMKECDTLAYCHPEKSVYNYNEWLDEDLIPLTNNYLSRSANNNNLIILHTIGSHWYYNNHYSKSFEFFKPITQSRIIAQCSTQEIINSYDNTVLYTDYFLNCLFEELESKKAIVIYLSDHGETLGEDGEWLHAGTNNASKNPACLIWYSDAYLNAFPEKIDALISNKGKRFRTDFLYHSILSAGSVPSKLIEKSFDVFSDN